MSTNQENTPQANFDNDEISLKDLILKMKKWFAYLKSKWKNNHPCRILYTNK